MTGLTIRADELIMAFEGFGTEMQHYFDRRTGEVLTVFEDMGEENAQLLDADPDRFLPIEPVPSSVSYEIMCDFVDTLPDGKVTRELARTLQQRYPFRRFKDVLVNYPETQEDWFRFHEQEFMKIIQEWLDDHEVEATLVSCHAQP
jgi:hypothetical protein